MKVRVYFRDGQITAICSGLSIAQIADEYRELDAMFDATIYDFEMHEGAPRLRSADSPPRRFGQFGSNQ